MRFLRTSFTTRLIAYFLAASILGGLLTTVIVFLLARYTMTQAVYDRLDAVATLKEEAFNEFVEDETIDLLLLADLSGMEAYAQLLTSNLASAYEYQQAQRALRQMFITYLALEGGEVTEVFFMAGVGGQVLTSSNTASEGSYRTTDAYYTQGRLDTFIQNVYPSPETGKPTMTISTPIMDDANRLLGVLAVHLNLEYLDAILQERTGLGSSGETYLVDRYNNFISTARYGGRAFPRGVHTHGIDTALEEIAGTALYNNYEGVPVIGAYRWLEDREVALLAEISQEEAFTPARQWARSTFLISSLLLALMAIGVLFISRQIARPILAVSEAARQVSEGNLAAQAVIASQDEVGALAQNFNQMTGRLRDLIEGLEQRVAERTQEVEQRSVYLQAATGVARAATTILDINRLIQQVVELIKEHFGLYYVGLFILDEAGEWAVLQAGSGEAGEAMLKRGHRIQVGSGMIGWAIANAKSRIAQVSAEDAVRLATPELPDTRAEAAIPLRSRERVLGAITVQSDQPNAFNESAIAALEVMADLVATAIDNARLFAESQTALDAARRAYVEINRRAWVDILQARPKVGYRYEPFGAPPSHVPSVWQPGMKKAAQSGQIVQTKKGEKFTLHLPISVRDQVIGVINLSKIGAEEVWSDEEIELVTALSEQIGIALDSARLYQETQRRAEREHLVSEITAKIRSTTDPQTMLQMAVEELRNILGASRVEIVPQTVSAATDGARSSDQD